jgi:hypothetical protein
VRTPFRRRWPAALAAILIGALAMAAATSTSWFASFGGRLEGARLERARRSPRFDGRRFVNPIPTRMLAPGSTWKMIRHQLFGDEERVPRRAIPVVRLRAEDLAVPPAGRGDGPLTSGSLIQRVERL